MTFSVFIHRPDSIYDDSPSERYQFGPNYLSRAEQSVGNWIVYLEPTKVPKSRGYFAVAKVEQITPDPTKADMFLALIEPGSYVDFTQVVPFSGPDGPIERGVLNESGKISGRAQSAVRPISDADFVRIVEAGLAGDDDILPRVDFDADLDLVQEQRVPFEFERPIIQSLTNRKKREGLFRRSVLAAYNSTCAVTGWKLINGGGRAEAEAAHIKPVEHNGPDSVQNRIALSGTVHWMFDRGLIGLSDDLDILIHRKVNDRTGVEDIINPSRKLIAPKRIAHRPHPAFLEWHRNHHDFVA